jgi:glycosyltransferase involved in cell wall biosynthesis
VEYIPNGVVVAKNTGANLLEKYKLEPNKYILMVSRLVRHKGAHFLLEAWQMARSQNPELFKDYKLAIVGGSSFTDDYVDELHYIARGDKSIVFTNWMHEQILEETYANCALYINPSENEGMPITVLQAMAYGRPVLLSDIPEHLELVSDRNFLFRNASIVDLAEKITKLIKNKELCTTVGLENKALAKKSFNGNTLSKQTLAVYTAKEKVKLARLKPVRA